MVTQALSGVRVADLMTPNPVVLPASMSVQEFLWTEPSQHRFTTFPVTSADGSVVGLVSLRRLLQVPEAARRETVLSDALDPLSRVATAQPSDSVTEVMSHMGPKGEGRVLVFDRDRLAGIVSPQDIAGAIPILMARAGL